jgi:hypothetical protein
MTANERLYVTGLIDEYYHAFSRGDSARVVQILKQVDLPDESINPILVF